MKEKYSDEVAKGLMEKFGYKNIMEIPKIEKVVLNMGVGEAVSNPKVLDVAINDMTIIAGQKPVVTRAKNQLQHLKSVKACRLAPKLPCVDNVCMSF
jgi:large subunit ribosomal protein L5